MPFSFSYLLSYANVPLIEDRGQVVSRPNPVQDPFGRDRDEKILLRKQQPEPELLDEINRLIPISYLADFTQPRFYRSKRMDSLAYPWSDPQLSPPTVRVGDWHYPNGIGRFSVFRYLATSSMVKAILAATNANSPATFIISAIPQGAINSGTYSISSPMYMLPPRPLAELGGSFDGLYLITLVDERYWFQFTPITLQVTSSSTWSSLFTQCANALGIILTVPSIPSAYGTRPSEDSQLWVDEENVAFLLDILAANVGMRIVRNFDGTYALQTAAIAQARVQTNRGSASSIIRVAGGDIFNATPANLPAGSLVASKNSVVPFQVEVSYSKYVTGNDPVPHYLNTRYYVGRPTSWYEDSHGASYNVIVPIASGGSLTSGVAGVSGFTHVIHSTSKALYSGELAAFAGTPSNANDLTTLAMQVAQDYFSWQIGTALDEVYPGTLLWSPEGYHDIVYSFSSRLRGAFTRVMTTQWNNLIRDVQHGTIQSGSIISVSGVGGKSVAQTWIDQSGNLVPGVNLVSVIGGIVSGNLFSGGIQETILTIPPTSGGAGFASGVPWTAGYTDNSLLISGMKLLRFDGSGFTLSGYSNSGSVDVYHAYGVSGDIRPVALVGNAGSGGKVARADHVHPMSGAIQSGMIVSGAVNVYNTFITSGMVLSGMPIYVTLVSGVYNYYFLGSGNYFAGINKDLTQYTNPWLLGICNNSYSGFQYGRILLTNWQNGPRTSGTTIISGAPDGFSGFAGNSFFGQIDWQGLRVYHQANAWFGPQPDLQIQDTTTVFWSGGLDSGTQTIVLQANVKSGTVYPVAGAGGATNTLYRFSGTATATPTVFAVFSGANGLHGSLDIMDVDATNGITLFFNAINALGVIASGTSAVNANSGQAAFSFDTPNGNIFPPYTSLSFAVQAAGGSPKYNSAASVVA